MKVEIDDAAYEAVLRMLPAALETLGIDDGAPIAERMQEKLLLLTLSNMTCTGALEYNFNRQRVLDVFRASPRLLRHWTWMFPGSSLNADSTSLRYIELKTNRKRFSQLHSRMLEDMDGVPSWPD